jgi:hypothetical protein
MIRSAVAAMLACTLSACHLGGGSTPPANTSPSSSIPSAQPSASSVDLAAQYPGQVGVHFASDPGASSKTVDCTSVNFDIVVGTDGRPVDWKAAATDNANIFIGNLIGGVDVAPASGTLQGGETTTVHVSGAPNSPMQTFWIGATDVRGCGATLEVDCAQ